MFEKTVSNLKEILNDPKKTEELVGKIRKKLRTIPVVGHYFADVPTLCLMVVDYARGHYREIPFATVLGILIVLLYFLSPIDLIPDAIPVLGVMDDAAAVGFALQAAHNDIAEYAEWKKL